MSSRRLDFSTRGLKPDARASAWRDYMAQAFFRLEFDTKGSDHEHGTLESFVFPGFSVTHYDLATQELMTRRKQVAADDSVEDFLFIFPFRGRFEFAQRSHAGVVDTQGLYALNSADGYQCFVSEGPRSLTLKLPLATLRERVSWIENCSARGDVADPALVPLVRQFCIDLARTDAAGSTGRLTDVLLDLVTLMVEGGAKTFRGERIPESMRNTLWVQLGLFVKRHFARHDLSVADAAKHFGVSTRYIQKVCSENDSTFQDMLMGNRLQEARRLIMEPGRAQALHVGQIAYLCGFPNQGHFSTRFRERFGLSPRDQRRLRPDAVEEVGTPA